MSFSGITSLLKDLAEQTTVGDSDYMAVGGSDLKKIKFSNLVTFLKEKLGINELNRNIKFGIEHASNNNVCTDTLLVSLSSSTADGNVPSVVTASTAHIPNNFAFGVREIIYINSEALILRLTGVKTDGNTGAVWIRVYNSGNWGDWAEL